LASQLRAFPFGFTLFAASLAGCGADAVAESKFDDRIGDSGKDMESCADCTGDADFAAPEAGFLCDDGTVVHEGYVCDGLLDCLNGEDETEQACPVIADDPSRDAGVSTIYVCRNGVEVAHGLRCDGVSDCPGGEDEFYCSTPAMPEGGDGGFVCADAPDEFGLDIADGWVCDGFVDCALGDDEEGCPEVGCDADAGESDAGACGDAGTPDAGY
jgi:hypothetical protein